MCGYSLGERGSKRKALLTSSFDKKTVLPWFTNCKMQSIASWTWWYLTFEAESGLLELTEEPLGWDRSDINQKVPGVFLGTKPTGLMRITGKGFCEKGPRKLPLATSLAMSVSMMSGLCTAVARLLVWESTYGALWPREKPSANPENRRDELTESYPVRKFANLT